MKRSFAYAMSGVVLAAAIAAVAGITACSFGNRSAIREMQTDTDSVQLGGAKSVHVALEMAPGNLRVSGGAPALMDATFRYNVPAWKPQVVYNVTNGEGLLTVAQSGSTGRLTSGAHNEWDLSFNDKVPLEMRVEVGAGRSQLSLGTLSLANLILKEGVGENDLDLRGDWKQNVSVSVDGGVGRTMVRLPEDVGARVVVEQGIGKISPGNLKMEGGAYVNSAFGKSAATVSVNIHAGVGEVELEQGGASAVN